MSENFNLKKDIEWSLESKKMDLNFFCSRYGLSRKTIYNQILNPSNYKTLGIIYNGLYDLGIRLNKIKAEIYQESGVDSTVALFHGSKRGLDQVLHNGSRKDCDFGPGFYLSKSYESALSFIEDYNESSVYAYSLNLKHLKILNLEATLDWMLLICHFRKSMDVSKIAKSLVEEASSVDVIIAPIADNKMFEILNDFQNGLITDFQALHALSASRLGKQYVLKSEKAIKSLKFLDRMFVCSKEKELSKASSQERANEIETKIFYAKREFRNKGKFIDELIK